jgi:hypothetical protein
MSIGFPNRAKSSNAAAKGVVGLADVQSDLGCTSNSRARIGYRRPLQCDPQVKWKTPHGPEDRQDKRRRFNKKPGVSTSVPFATRDLLVRVVARRFERIPLFCSALRGLRVNTGYLWA